MTRLFIRFYLGVIAILIAAWLIQSYLVRERSATQNLRVVEQALSGGARLARDELASASPRNADEAMQRIQARFEYPVNRFPLDVDWLTPAWKERLLKDEVVLFGDRIAIALPSQSSRRSESSPRSQPSPRSESSLPSELLPSALTKTPRTSSPGEALLLGPLPQFVGPSQTEVTFGYGIVFLLAAIAIAILLRPVVSQMRAVERTAAAIAQGDLSARIDSTKAPKDLALVRAFNSMADRTETLLRSQRELLQAVSHELRTPLARIRFAADLVESAKTDQERRTRLDAIDSATQKLDDLVGELLTYVRMDFQASNGPAETIDLHHLFSELIDIHAPLNPSIRFHDAGAGDPIRITTDRDGLARAIENLLSNAAKHAKREVCLQASVAGDQVLLFVDDDGEGVPIENRQKIFEPFVRLKDSQEPGTGLGLALVQRIVRRLSGEVDVGDSPLGGARFTVRLPRQAP